MADQPGYTQIPNTLMELIPLLPDAECRVLLVIARKTHGYHKACDVISISQLMDATGMVRQGVINGISAAIKRGVLTRTPSGHNNGYCYEIDQAQVVHEVDRLRKQSTKQTSLPSRPLVVHEVDHLAPQVVHEVDTQKKESKEKKEKRSRSPAASPLTENGVSPHKAIMDAYATALDYPMPDGPASAAAAKKLVSMGYTPEQVAACYKDQKARDFWRDKHLSLQSLTKCIGAWAQNKKPAHRNGSGPLVASKPNMPEHAVPLADLAAAARKQREQHNP